MAKRITAKVEEYQKDGQVKGRYVNIGVILSNDKGEYILLDPSVSLSGVLQQQNRTNHAAGRKTGNKVICSIFDDDNQAGSSGQSQGQSAPDLDDSEIPF